VVALFAGAGLFSNEAAHGTLPALFSLPLSRSRIWLAKALAGLCLALTGALLIVGLFIFLLPKAAFSLPITAYLPDCLLLLCFAFSISLFFSTLMSSTTNVVICSLLLYCAVAFGAGVICNVMGGALLGYDALLDLALWCGIFAPIFLLASAFVINKGELLQSNRKRLLAIPILLIGLFCSLALVITLTNLLTRYSRSSVQSISSYKYDGASPLAVLTTNASRVHYYRERGKGWLYYSPEQSNEFSAHDDMFPYRGNHQVILDVRTGKDLLVLKQSELADNDLIAFTNDGRYAAMFVAPRGLTWGGRDSSQRILRIYDLQQRKILFEGVPAPLQNNNSGFATHLEWSASGKYLVFGMRCQYGSESLYAISCRGTDFRELGVSSMAHFSAQSWACSTKEDVLYTLDSSFKLYRAPLNGGKATLLWSLPEPPSEHSYVLAFALSPDGNWLALSISRAFTKAPGIEARTTILYAVSTTTGKAYLITTLQPDAKYPNRFHHVRLAWTDKGQSLFICDNSPFEATSRLLLWKPGTLGAKQLGVDLPFYASLTAIPKSAEVLLYPYTGNHAPVKVDEQGKGKSILNANFVFKQYFIGIDNQDRLLTIKQAKIFATSMQTGSSAQLYP